MKTKEQKPIFTIGLPLFITDELFDKINYRVTEKLYDYHVLVYRHKLDDVIFELFNAKDADEINIEELKEFIKEQMTH